VPDSARAAARAATEAVWLPTALLPRFGVRWSAGSVDQVTAAFRVGDTPVELRLRLDAAGRIASLVFDRRATPTTAAAPAGTGSARIDGLRQLPGPSIPCSGRLG
jgi:Family of unknown function (DUF6544)